MFGTRSLLCLVTLGIGWFTLTAAESEAPLTEPTDVLAIRRVLLTPERLAQEMERLKEGVLRQMPRSEFEAKVRRAQESIASRRTPPRLSEARYRARLVNSALTGTGQWKVAYAGAGSGLLPLQSLNLAVHQPRFENGDAIIADFDGKTPALLIDGPGDRSVAIEWSARGEERPEGMHFDLKLPPCPVALLELDLPVDRVVAAVDGSLVSGPHPSESAERRIWRVGCGGRPGVDLWVRQVGPGAASPLLIARQQTTQSLEPAGVDATFQFDIEVLHQGVAELKLACDPELRPVDVRINDLASWSTRPGNSPNDPTVVTIQLSDPLPLGQSSLVLHCLAPLAPPEPAQARQTWRSPGVRLLAAVPRGETLLLRVHPEVELEQFNSGAFNITGTAPEAATESGAKVQRLTLMGGGLVGNPGIEHRPTADIRVFPVEYSARQITWWQPAKARPTLTVQVNYDVARGRLFQLPLLVPAGWEVNRVEMNPASQLRGWSTRPAKSGQGQMLLVVECNKAIVPATTDRTKASTLLLVLAAKPDAKASGPELRFPDVEILGARNRHGFFAISYEPQSYYATLKTLALEPDILVDGPWGRQAPDVVYPFRGKPVTGTLQLQPRASQFRARCATEVRYRGSRPTAEMTIRVEAESGTIPAIDLAISSGEGMPTSTWTVEGSSSLRSIDRQFLPQLVAAITPLASDFALSTIPLIAGRSRIDHQRLVLSTPLQPRDPPLVLRATVPLSVADGRIEIPLPSVIGARRMEGVVTINWPRTPALQLDSVGLVEASLAGVGRPNKSARSLRYTDANAQLTLRDPIGFADSSVQAVVDRATLTTSVRDDGSARHHLLFRVAGWSRKKFPLILPADAHLLGAQVDGHWIAIPLNSAGLPGHHDLPWPQSTSESASHRYEVLYETVAADSWLPWRSVTVLPPVWPVTPLVFRQSWRLPAGCLPMFQENLWRQPGRDAFARESGIDSLNDLLCSPLKRWTVSPVDASQGEALAAAIRGLRTKHAGQIVSLGELIEETANTYLHGRLVVDTLALREAGLDGDTQLTIEAPDESSELRAPWEVLGLTTVLSSAAPLLTSTSTQRGDRLSREAASATADAMEHGHDISGRFCIATDWLSQPTGGDALNTFMGMDSSIGATEWSSVATAQGDFELIIVKSDPSIFVGFVLTTLLLIGLWASRRRLRFLFAWIAIAALAAVWLPLSISWIGWLPLTVAITLSVIAYWRIIGRLLDKRINLPQQASAVLLLLVCSATARTLPPPGLTVYVLPSTNGEPSKENVLVSPQILEQLDTLASASSAAIPVLINAKYDGKVVGSMAEVGATFEAYATTETPAIITLALEGVRLEDDVLVDGKRVLPEIPEGRVGIAVPISGVGRHKIDVHFRVPIGDENGERSLRFAAPRLMQSRFRLHLPAGATDAHALVKHGGEQLVDDHGSPVLEVDIGRAPAPLHFHWTQETRPAKLEVREAHVWDLRADGSVLSSLLEYRATDGNISSLIIDVPEGLEVQSAEARRAEGAGPNSVRIRNWRQVVTEKERRLEVVLAAPATGSFFILLTFLPSQPLASELVLALPSPRTAQWPGERCHLAYRVKGVQVRREGAVRLTGAAGTAFAPFWPAGAGRPEHRDFESDAGGYAATFLRENGQGPQLRIRLASATLRLRADTQQIQIQVGSSRAEIEANLRMTAPDRNLAVVHVTLRPTGLQVSTVRGSNVRRWSQSGQQLTVWFESTTEEAKFDVLGWMPLDDQGRAEVPALVVDGTNDAGAAIKLVPETGLTLAVQELRGLQPGAGSTPVGSVSLIANQSNYGGLIVVRPESRAATVQVKTLLAVRDRLLTFRSVIEFAVPQGELRQTVVQLRNWDGDDVRIQADGIGKRRERQRPGERQWTLDLQAGVTGTFRIVVRGSMPLEDLSAGTIAPDLDVSNVAHSERWVALATNELFAEAQAGLVVIDASKQFGPAAGLGPEIPSQAWKIESPDWRLRLVPRSRPTELGPLQVMFHDQLVSLTSGSRWLHEATLILRHGTQTEMLITLPADGSIVATSIDGVDTPLPQQADRRRFWFSLPGRPGVRTIRVWYHLDAPADEIDRPMLDPPIIEGAILGPGVWTVNVPAGLILPGTTDLSAGRDSLAMLLAARARARYELASALADNGIDNRGSAASPALALRHFYRECQQAQQVLELTGESEPESIHSSTAQALNELRAAMRSLAEQRHFESARKEAEQLFGSVAWRHPEASEASGLVTESFALGVGTPAYAVRAAHEAAPTVRLTSAHRARFESALIDSAGWICILLAFAATALVPNLTRRLRWYWPEPLLLVGFILWLRLGLTPVTVVLLLVAAACRILGLVELASLLIRSKRNQTPASTVSQLE